MKISFDNLKDNCSTWDNFQLKWRFQNNDNISDADLCQIKPLKTEAALFLWNYQMEIELHKDFPFNKEIFSDIKKVEITDSNHDIIRKCLFEIGHNLDKDVYLSWQPDTALIVPWGLFIKHFDDFYYPISDDLTIIDSSRNWSILFFHENEIYFGHNDNFQKDLTMTKTLNNPDPTSIKSILDTFDNLFDSIFRN